MKIVRTFVAFTPKTIHTDTVGAYFFASTSAFDAVNIVGYHPSVVCSTVPLANVFGETWGDSLFYFHTTQISSTMPKTMKSECSRSIVCSTSAPTGAKTSPSYKEKYEIEKNAKNKAYFFILSHGLIDQFSDFCKSYQPTGPHDACVALLYSQAIKIGNQQK